MRGGIGLAEHQHEAVPALAGEEPLGEPRLALDAVTEAGERPRVPAGIDAKHLKVGKRKSAVWRVFGGELGWMYEARIGSRRHRRIEAADHVAVDPLRWI